MGGWPSDSDVTERDGAEITASTAGMISTCRVELIGGLPVLALRACQASAAPSFLTWRDYPTLPTAR